MDHRKGKAIVILAGTVLFGTVLFGMSPRVELDETPRSSNLPVNPQELDAYLQEAESAFGDLVPGTEKKILWHEDAGEQTDIAVVHLHERGNLAYGAGAYRAITCSNSIVTQLRIGKSGIGNTDLALGKTDCTHGCREPARQFSTRWIFCTEY